MEQSDPLVQPLNTGSPMSATKAPAVAGQYLNDTTDRTQFAIQPDARSPAVQAHAGRGWSRCLQAVNRGWRSSWTTETCSFIVSILALGGLVATLVAHQNKPRPEWPQMVTINSIMSLFSLLIRACVGVVLAEGISQCKWNWYRKAKKLDHIQRLDAASRSSWGSVTLLYHFRPRQAYWLAALGALVTIMASLLGFFSQQLVQFQDCLEKDTTALANIARTNSYARSGGKSQNNAAVDYAPMVAAINTGMLQPTGDLTSTLSSGCNSGNCTFSSTGNASFSTLAISHFCEDSTAQIRIINETRNNNTIPAISWYLGLDYGDNQTFEWSTDTGGVVLSSWVDTPSYLSSRSDLAAIYFLSRPKYDRANVTDWTVTNCSLSPTINTYSARIRNAILEEEENLVDRVPLQTMGAQFKQPPVNDVGLTNLTFLWTYQMTTDYTVRDGERESCEGSESPAPGLVKFPKSSDEPTYVNSTGYTNPSAGWKWWYYPGHCIWSMHKYSNMAIVETLKEVFDDQNASMAYKGGLSGSAHLRVLFKDGNMTFDSVDKQMKSLATSMTTIVRTAGGDGTEPYIPDNANGTVWTTTTCMYIRWSWISFPAVMIGLTGLFLVLVAFENRGVESDRLWKSSFLAALFCEVEMHEKPAGKEEMKAMAKSTSVSLEGKSGTLRLVAG